MCRGSHNSGSLFYIHQSGVKLINDNAIIVTGQIVTEIELHRGLCAVQMMYSISRFFLYYHLMIEIITIQMFVNDCLNQLNETVFQGRENSNSARECGELLS